MTSYSVQLCAPALPRLRIHRCSKMQHWWLWLPAAASVTRRTQQALLAELYDCNELAFTAAVSLLQPIAAVLQAVQLQTSRGKFWQSHPSDERSSEPSTPCLVWWYYKPTLPRNRQLRGRGSPAPG